MQRFVIKDGRVVEGPDEEELRRLSAELARAGAADLPEGMIPLVSGEVTIDPVCDETGIVWSNVNVQN